MTTLEKGDSPLYPSLTKVAFVAACFKVLLFPAYKSTDFEVHRNWLAITYSLPPWKWYFENTSEWTLDYPPFFAGFEWLLAQVAPYFDPGMLNVKGLGYGSWQTVVFQRSSVILTEGTLLLALHLYIQSQQSRSTRQQALAVALSIFLSPGLLIIDHIHFQYNGFMYGLLVLSLILARKPSGRLYSGLLFGALLCFKHIYLYLAPAYFVFLLRGYCLGPKSIFDIQFVNCIKLGVGLVVIFGIAFGPFVYWGQIDQLLSRLFPFSRGLCHAYWAPNVWALYSFVDRVLLIAAQKAGWNVNAAAINSVTRGLVGDTAFAILPEITPRVTFILTLFFQVIPLVKVFFRPTWTNFIASVTLCGYASFLFGWHVHEKAVLLMLIPFSLMVLQSRRYLSCFRPLAIAGHISLFPLLFTNPESTIKISYTLFWLIVFMYTFDKLAPAATNKGGSGYVWAMVDRLTGWYGLTSIPLVIYTECFHSWLWNGRYEFLPLLAVSVFTAIGVVGSWLGTMAVFLLE